MAGDEREFGGEFSDEGIARLRERVNEKLKEFMGDYTDDTLVEYVIVLLKNGRRKDEAKGELNVFLGDDSDTFVSWLWNHLGSHLSLYVQLSAPHPDQAPNVKSSAGKQAGKTELQHTSSEADKRTSDKTSGKRYNREGKGLERDKDENVIPLSRNSLAVNAHSKDNPQHRVDQTKLSPSPRPIKQKKRRQTEEQHPRKRKISQETISAPKRLLQFAVREAVGTSRLAEPSLKCLRSVVSSSTEDVSPKEHPQRTRPLSGLRADMSAAIKAVSDAVKDLSKDRPSRNVFDRLDLPTIASSIIEQEELRNIVDQSDFVNESEDFHSTYDAQNDGMVQQDGSSPSFDDNPVVASDFGVGYNDYDDMMGQRVANLSGLYRGILADNSLQFQYHSTNDSEGRERSPRQDRLVVMPSKSFKIASSANMNILRLPQFQESMEGSKMHNLEEFIDSDDLVSKSEAWVTKENSLVGSNGHARRGMDPKHKLQTAPVPIGLYSTGGPTEDADSRTIFLNNVHFAATKDSLSRHFNKFGEVLKVIILTEPATGEPKGSAYIEFMRKEAAEHALSLDGTSFMSRFLKIVRKGSVQPEAVSLTTWPRVARASPFCVPRFSRGSFARGIPASYRSRIPSKPVARSFQWKRGATLVETSTLACNTIAPPSTARGLTYVRMESKANGSSGTE